MKKLFTLFAAAMAMLSAQATDYTCPLTVVINGSSSDCGDVTVSISAQDDGKYTLSLNNFVLGAGDEVQPIGNIVVKDVDATVCGTTTVLSSQQTITIADGTDSNYDYWLGSFLGEVPILLKAELKGETLNAVLNIAMSSTMLVAVQLGNKAAEIGQIPNSGFSEYHTATYKKNTSDEPNSWHSFMSATGSLVSQVAGATHTYQVNESAPSSTDGKSVQIKSTTVKVLNKVIASANGTITTGRLKAGSMSASNADNCSFADLSTTDVDGNNDSYYTILTTKPDAIKTWLKYKVGARTSSNKNEYATISAIINDGTYVQDPEKSEYSSSIIARASNTEITSKNEEWQEITIPFTYTESTAQPKSILVTMSTCSVASGGSQSDSEPDVLTVDSVALVYNAELTSLKVKGSEATLSEGNAYTFDGNGAVFSLNDIEVVSNGQGAYVSKSFEQDDKNVKATIFITSNDLKTANAYTLTITNATVTGINNVSAPTLSTSSEIYNAAGQRISTMQRGLNIIRKDGKTIKLIQK